MRSGSPTVKLFLLTQIYTSIYAYTETYTVDLPTSSFFLALGVQNGETCAQDIVLYTHNPFTRVSVFLPKKPPGQTGGVVNVTACQDDPKRYAFDTAPQRHIVLNEVKGQIGAVRITADDMPECRSMTEKITHMFQAAIPDVGNKVPAESEVDLCKNFFGKIGQFSA